MKLNLLLRFNWDYGFCF